MALSVSLCFWLVGNMSLFVCLFLHLSVGYEPNLRVIKTCPFMQQNLRSCSPTPLSPFPQFIVLGTDYGTLHVLDSLNGTESKMYQQVCSRSRLPVLCSNSFSDTVPFAV